MLKTFRTFYRFVLKKRFVFVVLIILIISSAILSSITPYFFKLFVNALPALNSHELFKIVLLYVATSFASLAISILSYFVGDIILFEASADARKAIFKYVLDLDFVFHSSKSTGSLISAFKRGDGAFFDMFHIIHHRIFEVVIGFLVMVYFFSSLNPLFGVVAIVSMLLTLFATRLIIAYNVKMRNLFNTQEDNIAGIVTDNMINYETVKLFAQEKHEENRLAEAFKPWLHALWGFGNSFRIIDGSIGTIVNLSLFTILALGVNASVTHKIGLGDFILITAFTSSFFPRLWDLVWSSRDMAKAYSDIQTYFALLDNEIEVKDPANPVKLAKVEGNIEFNNINFKYKNRNKNAINGINLKIKKGEAVALVGRSGSGKTTLGKLLMRFYDLTGGEITIDGINIKDFAKSTLRSFIGVVPQEPILFNNTIEYNIGYGKDNPKFSEIRAAAKIANIDGFIQSLPKKYQTEVGERGVKLSGGQKQRLAIARMILSDPDIVVFDEATSHLDSESEKLIQDAFWKARAGKTTIIIAHRLSTIMRADKIVVMERGQIKEIGTHKDLINRKNSLYSHFWNLQIQLD